MANEYYVTVCLTSTREPIAERTSHIRKLGAMLFGSMSNIVATTYGVLKVNHYVRAETSSDALAFMLAKLYGVIGDDDPDLTESEIFIKNTDFEVV